MRDRMQDGVGLPGRAGGLLDDLLATESASARIEGAFLADPELGRLWRAQMALGEACRSVALEDIHLTEGDLVLRPFTRGETEMEIARGSYLGRALLRVLAAPGDLRTDPEEVLSRCLRAGENPELVRARPEELIPDLGAVTEKIVSEIETAPGPVLASIRAAAHLRAATGSELPAAERLLFSCVDHAWRAPLVREVPGGSAGGADGVPLPTLSANWILLPSMAMTAQGFRAWSPLSRTGLGNLLAGLRLETSRALGLLPVLRHWRDRARAFAAAAHGKSHLDALVSLLIRQPILTGRGIAGALGVTDRSARNLVDACVAAGLVAPITGRRSYRAWAPLPMAEHLRRRAARAGVQAGPRLPGAVGLGGKVPVSTRMPETDGAGEAAALAELEDAIAAADAILTKYRMPGR